MDSSLSKEVRFYMAANELTYGDYLFHQVKHKNKPWGILSSHIFKMLKEAGLKGMPDADGNKGGVNLFRHAKISSLAPDADAATRAKLAEQMRHLPSTQLTYVRSTVN